PAPAGRGDLREGSVLEVSDYSALHVLISEPALEIAAEAAVLLGEQGGSAVEICGDAFLQIRGEIRSRAEADVGGDEEVVEDFSRETRRGGFVGKRDIETVGTEQREEVGQLPFVAGQLHGRTVFEDGTEQLVSHQFGK